MRTAMRAAENPALQVALQAGQRLHRPVFVYQGLSERHACDRHSSAKDRGAALVDRSDPAPTPSAAGASLCSYSSPTMTVTIRELKNRLSEYLRRVRAGEQLVVTDHGLPVATVEPIRPERLTVEQRLELMAEAGDITQPREGAVRWTKPTSIRGRPLSRSLLEDRG